MQFAGRILSFVGGWWGLMVLAIVSSLLFTAMNLIPPLLIRHAVFMVQGTPTTLPIDSLELLFGLLVASYLLRSAFLFGGDYYAHLVSYHVLHDLRIQIYAHLQTLSHSFFTRRQTGSIMSTAIQDVEIIEYFLAHAVPQLVISVTVPVAVAIVLVMLDSQLALYALIPVPFLIAFSFGLLPALYQHFRHVRHMLSEVNALVQDYVSGIAVIKAFTWERPAYRKIEKRSGEFREAVLKVVKFSQLPVSFVELMSGIGIAIVVWAGASRAMAGQLSTADLFAFVIYLTFFYRPIADLARALEGMQNAMAASERIFELLDTRPAIVEAPNAVAPAQVRWTVEFKNVTFGYLPHAPVLRNVSFRVEEGDMVALVGPSGAGKTTITSLLARFYDPQAGQVLIGGHDVQTLSLKFVRQNVSLVLQDVFLFHGTVRDNLLIGKPDATEEELLAAAGAANAHDFIVELPRGYDTLIGERGVRLSGGQKQRLSIARALLKNAPILVLDEATSSVDTDTESLIQDALKRLMVNRTTLVVAHRLSTIRHAQKILVLSAGEIVETGSHAELLQRGGLYAHLYRTQLQQREWEVTAPVTPGESQTLPIEQRARDR